MVFTAQVSAIIAEQRAVIARSCIAKVCQEAKRLRELQRKEGQKQRLKFSTNEVFDIFNEDMDLNLIVRAVTVLQYGESGIRVITRFPMEDEYSSMFCFFAYYHEEDDENIKYRRCFVFWSPCAGEIVDALGYAIELFCQDQEKQKMDVDDKTQANDVIAKQIPSLQLDGADVDMTVEPEKSKASEKPAVLQPPSESVAQGPSTSSNYLSTSTGRSRRRRDRSISQGRLNSAQRQLLLDEQFANVWREPWFHGVMDRATAESLIPEDGQYLVRLSPNGVNQFVLSGRGSGKPCHISLTGTNGKLSNSMSNSFKTIVGFVYYCVEHPRYLPDHDIKIFLKDAVKTNRSYSLDQLS